MRLLEDQGLKVEDLGLNSNVLEDFGLEIIGHLIKKLIPSLLRRRCRVDCQSMGEE